MKTTRLKQLALIVSLGLGFTVVGCASMPAADVAGSASMNSAKKSPEDGATTRGSR